MFRLRTAFLDRVDLVNPTADSAQEGTLGEPASWTTVEATSEPAARQTTRAFMARQPLMCAASAVLGRWSWMTPGRPAVIER